MYPPNSLPPSLNLSPLPPLSSPFSPPPSPPLSLVPYVREQLLHTVALMVKRATLEDNRRELSDSVFTTVSQLLMMDVKMVGGAS